MKVRTNVEWLRELTAEGEAQVAAIADLRLFLLRTSLYSLNRSRGDLPHLTDHELEQMAEDNAQEALLAILQHLPEFRSDSKFTTWAYKFAVNFSLVSARRERWKQVSLDQLVDNVDLPERPIRDEHIAISPDRAAAQAEVWTTIREVINHDLTERQRQALKALVFDEVPIDEVARHFEVNRNTIYKLLHDARYKLKARLETRGYQVDEILGLFGSPG